MRSGKKMRYDSIEKTVHAKFEWQEKSKKYPCGPHGTKSTWYNLKHESLHSFHEDQSDRGVTCNKVSHGKTMRQALIERTVIGKLE
jgi:hypothetical protein